MPKLTLVIVAVAFALAGAVTTAQAQSREQFVSECRNKNLRATPAAKGAALERCIEDKMRAVEGKKKKK